MTVDINKLYDSYHVTQKAQAELQDKHDAVREKYELKYKALSEVTTKLKLVMAELGKKNLPQEEKENLRKDFQLLVSQYDEISKKTQKIKKEETAELSDITQKMTQARHEGLKEITQVVKEYAKDNGYQWVMETSGQTNTKISPLVYAKNAEDKTEDILRILNKNAPFVDEPSLLEDPFENTEENEGEDKKETSSEDE